MSPVELARKYVIMSRRIGRTQELINALPKEKCAIITSNEQYGANLKKRIIEQRPDLNIDNIEFLTYVPNSGLRNMHVYFDNDVLDDIIVHHVSSINSVYGKSLTSE